VCWSPDFGTNLALAMIERDFWDPGTKVEVETSHGVREATVGPLPFA
jgi:dimethylsulfoniopropionate demethylase